MSDMPIWSSPYYPYRKEIASNGLRGAELIPYKLLRYLLDLPDGTGYQPPDNNDFPRPRLAKLLWYDDPNPLSKPLPTPQQKLSMLFDPQNPDINTDELKTAHPKGYRLYWQRMVGQSQTEAQTILKCYIGRMFEQRKFETTIGITFEVLCNVNLETNLKTNAYQRSFDIEQCLHEALDGVNFTGIGTMSFARNDHLYNASEPLWDEVTNFGRTINFSLLWEENGVNTIPSY